MFFNCRNALLALPILAFMSASDPSCSSIMLPSASAGMLSGPAAFPLLICLMAILISSVVGGLTSIGRSVCAAFISDSGSTSYSDPSKLSELFLLLELGTGIAISRHRGFLKTLAGNNVITCDETYCNVHS
ncbi:unnamed protein product [Schistosoma margrebowiei]|uniref:Uncharacterized protein n=1 Tax=Schistosoma margrebowiei TaxID=48269 RepID=A0A183M290_9TREM|nr:unnamed protein product [Schistosoma margrebowiei]